MKYPFYIFFISFCSLLYTTAGAQTVLSGKVVDDKSLPVDHAKVYLKNFPNYYTLTNRLGNFKLEITVSPDQFDIGKMAARKKGFEMKTPAQIRGNQVLMKLYKQMPKQQTPTTKLPLIAENTIEKINDPKTRTRSIINKLKKGKPLHPAEVEHLAGLVFKIDRLTNQILLDKETNKQTIDSLKQEIGTLKESMVSTQDSHNELVQGKLAQLNKSLKEKDELLTHNIQKRQEAEQRKQDLIKARKKKTQWQIFGLVALVLVLMVLVLVFYLRSRGRKTLQQTLLEAQRSKEELAIGQQEIKVKNDELEQIQTSKEILTTTIAHDLRNPLNVIMGYSTEETADCPKETLKARLGEIHFASQRIESYIDDIVAIQKYAYSGLKIATESNSLYEVAEMAVAQMRPFIKQKSLQVHNNFPENLYSLFNFKFIERVFINLLNNAIKFTPTGGSIRFDAEVKGQVIHVSFSDTGEGISKEKFKEIFEPFVNKDARHFASETSSSLGLVFCKIALESHGSKIGVTSELGQGTTFTFDLAYTHKKPKKSYLPGKTSVSTLNGKSKKNGTAPMGAQSTIQLSEEDKSVLRPFVKELNHYELYEVSDLEEVLARLNTSENANLAQWKKALQNAIDNYNELEYKELVKSIA
ncbi:ATP-binding protein [uncultured Microscilla sp.]|uniref:ATP-binding protein n=1 Tax=uncultured Microscilla sp. TaxID=432653 RepID=UPI002619B5CF|nr:ATP-binding protein [uncultured Microscilla sp.]